MINMARIQGPSLGYPGFQKPILRYGLGQDGVGVVPAGAPSPIPSPSPDFNWMIPQQYPQFYNYPVIETPVPTPTPAPAPSISPWLLALGGVGAGIALALLLAK